MAGRPPAEAGCHEGFVLSCRMAALHLFGPPVTGRPFCWEGGEWVAKTKQQKAETLEALREKMGKSQSAILADYMGLNVEEVTELRRKLREAGVEFLVVKNTLVNIVASEMGLDSLKSHLAGPTAIAFGVDDPVAPAKGLSEFMRDKKKMAFKAGVLSGKVISLEEVKALADIEPRPVLLAKALGAMQSPLVGFASVLQAPIRSFATAVDALRKQRAASNG